MSQKSSIFDMIGPVMIGPSSSHTAGVVRIGRVARQLLGVPVKSAEITFYNSFARTYEGHGSDRAVLAGLLNMETDDERIKTALDVAQEAGLEYKFKAVTNASALHPNTIRISASTGEASCEVTGISRGGGLVSIVEIDGYRCNFTAQQHTLILTAKDIPGSISFVATTLASDDCNIATMTVDRQGKKKNAKLVIEVDSAIHPLTVEFMNSRNWIDSVVYIPDIHL